MTLKPKPFRYRSYTTSSSLRLNPKRRNAKLRKRLGLPPASYTPRSIEITTEISDASSSSAAPEPQQQQPQRLVDPAEINVVVHKDGCTCPRGRRWADKNGGLPPCLKDVDREVLVGCVMRTLGVERWDKGEWEERMRERREAEMEVETVEEGGIAREEGEGGIMEVEIRPSGPVG